MELANNVFGWIMGNQQSISIKDLANHQVLNIANEINGLLSELDQTGNNEKEIDKLSMPRLVVAGTQSSGKSSVLNGFTSIDILPTGSNMVTRTPLDMRLHKTKTINAWIEFGSYNDLGWCLEKKFNLTMPIPTPIEIEAVREHIKNKTIEITGGQTNISHTPIILQLYSPNVPDISLVDLPGLIAVDDSEGTLEQIESLVSAYIKKPKTIVLVIMQARSDLETDIGLAFVKKHTNPNTVLVGVMTKPDLMNTDSHVGDYLLGKVSKNLLLNKGYFVVKNRANQEMKEVDIFKGLDAERKYFQSHVEYKKAIYSDRLGYDSLIKELTNILVSSIQEAIPMAMNEIVIIENNIKKKLDILGKGPPNTKETQMSEINLYVNSFSQRLCECIESRGTMPNIGREIKQVFDNFRESLDEITPFKSQEDIYTDEFFNDLVSSFEGYHMSYSVPPIDLLERCISDGKHKPIQILRKNCIECLDAISQLLIKSIQQIAQSDQYSRFPQLAHFMIKNLIDEVIMYHTRITENKIDEILQTEQDYLWTDDEEFKEILKKFSAETTNETFKELLESYFSTIKRNFKNTIPKYIFAFLIRTIQRKIINYLAQNLVKEDKISLLKEDPNIEKQRQYYDSLNNRIVLIKKLFSK